MSDSRIIKDQRNRLEKKAVEILTGAVRRSISERNRAVVGVPGGRSVGAVLEKLELGSESIDWSLVHFFMVDERLVEAGHPESNFELVRACLEPFVPGKSLHPFPHAHTDHEAARLTYNQELEHHGGRFDVVLLSSGEDGHIASLFPAHETFLSEEPMFLLTDSAPKPPPARMSASKRLISMSHTGIILFFGNDKKDALRMFLDESIPMSRCPAKIINNLSHSLVLTDQLR